MKKTIKKLGRIFVDLAEKNRIILTPKILVVDNGYASFFQLESCIEKLKIKFPETRIEILTFEYRESKILNNFPDVKIYLASNKWIKKYQIAFSMLKLWRKNFDFVVLLSLDITPVIVSLLFMRKKKVLLYNKYFQWWQVRLRNLGESLKYVPKSSYVFSLKKLLNKIGNRFIYLALRGEELLKYKILVIDNGYAKIEQITKCLSDISMVLPNSKNYLLTYPQRRNHFIEELEFTSFIDMKKSFIKRYQLALNMLRIRKQRFDYVVLPSLDISPLIVTLLFLRKDKVLLYNKWHQWWVLKFRNVSEISLIPKTIGRFIINIFIFLYLLLVVSLIYLKRMLNTLLLKTDEKRVF